MIYLDNSSTSKPDPAAIKAAVYGMEHFGNPSSPHAWGTEAAMLLKEARKDISLAMKCEASEIYFTSCGSESNNTAILGLAHKNAKHSKRIITTDSEHPSVSNVLHVLEKEGFEIIKLSTKQGKIDYSELSEALSEKTGLVTIMQVNNETGAEYNLEKIRKEIDISECGAFFHSDCVQSFMKVSSSFAKYCDAASVSAHKIGGIKGCGALFLKKGIKIDPFINGGGQEKGMRSGTENIPGILAFSAACKIWNEDKKARNAYISSLKVLLKNRLEQKFGDEIVFNLPEKSVCSILNFSLPGVKSETLINGLSSEDIYVSASSACSTHAKENTVLGAFGLNKNLSESAIRVGISYANTEEEIEIFCEKLFDIYKKVYKK